MSAFQSVPVIDVEALVRGEGDVAAVAREIGDACRNVGFFYVKGHGVDCEGVEVRAREFFQSPLDQKLSVAMGDSYRGYVALGTEHLGEKADFHEGMTLYLQEHDNDHPEVVNGNRFYGQNPWPEFLPGWRDDVMQYFESVTALGHALMRGMAMSLDLDPEYFTRAFTSNPFACMRMLWYPPQPRPDSAVIDEAGKSWSLDDIGIGLAEHTDYGCITMLLQDDIGGLQVQNQEGEWIAVEPIPGTFVINIGDMMAKWTGNAYRATVHRVIVPHLERGDPALEPYKNFRLSIPVFFEPNFDTVVVPLFDADGNAVDASDPAIISKEGIRFGDYLTQKYNKNYDNDS